VRVFSVSYPNLLQFRHVDLIPFTTRSTSPSMIIILYAPDVVLIAIDIVKYPQVDIMILFFISKVYFKKKKRKGA
jgi:hypothetical protein